MAAISKKILKNDTIAISEIVLKYDQFSPSKPLINYAIYESVMQHCISNVQMFIHFK